jgi:hypothetical protein
MKNFKSMHPKFNLFLGMFSLSIFMGVSLAALNLTAPVMTPTIDTTPSFTFSSDSET